MRGERSWTELVAGRGPDHFLELIVDGDVGARIRALDTTGFTRTELRDAQMVSEVRGARPPAPFDLYADDAHHAPLLANFLGTARSNVWQYQIMMVDGGRIWIEHGYGTSSPAVDAAEARVLALATTGAVRLVSWSIEYGGQGYVGAVARAGRSAAELAAALAWDP